MNVTFATVASWYGTENLRFTVSDGSLSASGNVNVIVTQVFAPPAIQVAPLNLVYGEVSVGNTSVKQFTIQNTGEQTLTGTITTPTGYTVALSAARTDELASRQSLDTRNALSFSVNAGSNKTYDLSFAPTAGSAYNGNVVITSNASNSGTVNVTVTGTGTVQLLPVNPRFVAEWEPAKGAIVRYPFGQPYPLLKDMSNNGLLYVVVTSASQSACNTALSNNGVNMGNVRYINASTDSYWTRDYGPWTIFEGSGQMKIVDFTYNRPRPNDDILPVTVANYLGVGYYSMPLVATGGNVMCDGHAAMMSTQLILEENPTLTEAQIDVMAQQYLGITDYQFYVDPNNTYIDHIDCWGKLLDVDKVIIRQVPTSHAQYSDIEATVAAWQAKTSGYGTPYKIYRVNTPNNEPYSNSYIMNKAIYVPKMGNATNDNAALAVYQSAMPGYTVIGYTHTNWESTDALHCRVNTVYDEQMIHAWHVPPISATGNSTVAINVELTHANTLSSAGTYVAYRHTTTGTWLNAPLTFVTGTIWTANVPTPAYNQTLYYYILATDTTGRTVTMPLCGSNDPFKLRVNIPGANTAPTIALPTSFTFAQNGTLTQDFGPYVDDAETPDTGLSLTCSGNSNVTVSISGMNVTFGTAASWYGTENLTFTVSDGALAASGNVNVIVTQAAAVSEAIIGTGTSSNGTTTACPINVYYKSLHTQSLYKASELIAAGVNGPVQITQIGFYVSGIPAVSMPSYVIRLGHTTAANASAWLAAANLSTVWTSTSYRPTTTGWNMVTLTTPFTWDGSRNLVIDTAYGLMSSYNKSGTTRYTSNTKCFRYGRSDTANQTNVFSGGSTSNYRPNLKLIFASRQTFSSDALVTKLHQNFPNPFNPETTISFDMGQTGPASLSIYNVKGQRVTTLVDSDLSCGRHSYVWKGTDNNGNHVSSGVYFYRLITPGHTEKRQMILMK